MELKSKEQIAKDSPIRRMSRDELVEWLLLNVKEEDPVRVYAYKEYVGIGIDRNKL